MKKIINPWLGIEGYNCFGCAPTNEVGVKMEFYENGDEIISFWKPQACYQGWLNTLHGGIQAVLLDEICAWVIARKLQTTGVTAKMETRYLKPVSTAPDESLTLKAHIVEQHHNLVTLEAFLYNAQEELCSRATCLYYIYTPEVAREKMFFNGCEVEDQEVLPLI